MKGKATPEGKRWLKEQVMAGKGDSPRPNNRQRYEDGHERTFGFTCSICRKPIPKTETCRYDGGKVAHVTCEKG